ncbi:MAG: glycosyltransferase family 39 protein [Pyrinomonadaceae bacterium]|nr:glycosyltransferase family 39 protein [Pyrinomonadaceae bacterium]
MSENHKKYVLILLLLHLAVALPLAYFLNIWVDEASSLYTTERGFFFALQNALTDEKQAPLYFWLLSLWRSVNGSILFARLLSIFFSLLAIRFFFALAQKLFDEKAAFFLTAFFALHPYLFWASLEIRVYSLVVFLSVWWLNLFFENFVRREDAEAQKGKDFLFVLLSVVALYTNYYLGFLFVGGFAALLVLRKWRGSRTYFLQMIIVGAFILPLLWVIKAQFAVNTKAFQEEKEIIIALKIFWNHFMTFVLPTEIYPSDEVTQISAVRNWFIRAVILMVAFFAIRKRREILNEKTLVFGVISAVIFAFLLAAYLLLGEVYIGIRHLAVVFVPVILAVSLVVIPLLPRKSLIFLSVFYLSLFGYSLYALYPKLAKRGDWARVGEFIAQNERPNQPIIVFTTFDALALPYHYKGQNKIFPDEKFFDWEAEAAAGSAQRWAKQTEFIISEIPPEANEIWLLTNEKCEIKDACLPLENFVERNYTIVEERDFYQEKVRLLRKKVQ